MARQDGGTGRGAKRARFGSLPNILTYGRILAIPALVACFFVAADWGRVAGDVDLHRRRRHRFLRRLSGARLAAAKQLRPDARSHRRQADRGRRRCSCWPPIRPSPAGRCGPAVIILCREILVSGLREFLGDARRVSVPVTQLAKWKTADADGGDRLPAGGLAPATRSGRYTTLFGLSLLWIAALLTLYTGYDYLRAAIGHAHARTSSGMRLLYFAWVKEKIGIAAEDVDPPRRHHGRRADRPG